LTTSLTSEERVSNLAEGRLRAGRSIYSQKIVLDECHAMLTSPQSAAGPQAVQRSAIRWCAETAKSFAAQSVSFSYARLVAAEAGGLLGDHAELNDGLLTSQRTAPSELWLAARRVSLAERYRGQLRSDTAAAIDDDIRLNLLNEAGAEAIAYRMLRSPAFRERVTSLAETMSEDVKWRLVRKVSFLSDKAKRNLPGTLRDGDDDGR
jgi:hypothetical protein